MRCEQARAQALLSDDERARGHAEAHLRNCPACAAFAGRIAALDALLSPALLVEPPAALRAQLASVARSFARPRGSPSAEPAHAPVSRTPSLAGRWWMQATRRVRLAPWTAHGPTAVAQVTAGAAVALASWQVYGWLGGLGMAPVVGDVPRALALVAASPTLSYLADLPADLQGAAMWALVGAGGWTLSESGPIGRRWGRLASREEPERRASDGRS